MQKVTLLTVFVVALVVGAGVLLRHGAVRGSNAKRQSSTATLTVDQAGALLRWLAVRPDLRMQRLHLVVYGDHKEAFVCVKLDVPGSAPDKVEDLIYTTNVEAAVDDAMSQFVGFYDAPAWWDPSPVRKDDRQYQFRTAVSGDTQWACLLRTARNGSCAYIAGAVRPKELSQEIQKVLFTKSGDGSLFPSQGGLWMGEWTAAATGGGP